MVVCQFYNEDSLPNSGESEKIWHRITSLVKRYFLKERATVIVSCISRMIKLQRDPSKRETTSELFYNTHLDTSLALSDQTRYSSTRSLVN